MIRVNRLLRGVFWFLAFFAAAVLVFQLARRPEVTLTMKAVVLLGLMGAAALAALWRGARAVRLQTVEVSGDDWRRFQRDAASRISLVAAVAGSLAAGLLSSGLIQAGPRPMPIPVSPPLAVDTQRHLLKIDGNRNGDYVVFTHETHRDLMSADKGCARCHHLHKPGNYSTPCRDCHQDMAAPTCIFDHELHQRRFGGNQGCETCHDLSRPKGKDNAPECLSCHQGNLGYQQKKNREFSPLAPCYPEAMRGTCLGCHVRMARMTGNDQLASCDCCHRQVKHTIEELKPAL